MSTFRLDRMVQVLAHIKLSETKPVEAGIHPGEIAHMQETWGEFVAPSEDLLALGFDFHGEDEYIAPGGVIVNDSCGTALCAAGWALVLSGVEQLWEESIRDDGVIHLDLRGTAERQSTQSFAREWLGVDATMRHGSTAYGPILFAPTNKYADLVAISAEYASVEVHTVNEMVEAEIAAIEEDATHPMHHLTEKVGV